MLDDCRMSGRHVGMRAHVAAVEAHREREQHETPIGRHEGGRGDDRRGNAEFSLLILGGEAKDDLVDVAVFDAKTRRLELHRLHRPLGT